MRVKRLAKHLGCYIYEEFRELRRIGSGRGKALCLLLIRYNCTLIKAGSSVFEEI